MSTLIIYHQRKGGHDCPDGLGAAWAAAKKYPNSQAMGWTYEAECLPPIPDGCDRIVVVDFSFPTKVLEQWRESVSEVIVIDHHKTAMDMLDGLSARVLKYFDMDECGATLAWKTFFPDEPVPVFLQYFRDRDLWCHELSFTREVHEAISNMRHKLRQQHYTYLPEIFALFDGLAKLSRDELTVMAKAVSGDKIAELVETEHAIADSWVYGTVAGHFVPVVYLKADGSEDRHISWAMNHLYTELCPEALFVACYTSKGTCELRSNKNSPAGGFDVGELARELGGGGHRNAAGFNVEMNPNTFEGLITIVRGGRPYQVQASELQADDFISLDGHWLKAKGFVPRQGWELVPCPQPPCSDIEFENPAIDLVAKGLRRLF